MDILQIHNRYRQRGGEDIVVEREAELLRSAGHRVAQHQVRNPSGELGAGMSLLLAPWNPVSFGAVGDAVDRFRPDLAHLHNTWFQLSPSTVDAVARRNIPIVLSLHNYRLACMNGLLLRDGKPCELCVGVGPGPGLRHRCCNGSLIASSMAAATLALNRSKGTWDRVSVFLANSGFVREEYVAAGFDPDRIEVKPNFVADPGPRRHPPSQSEVVLFVGRVSDEKGIELMARVWDRWSAHGLRLEVIGDGPLLAAMAGRFPQITFTGPLPPSRVREQMLRARALVFPSITYETNPLAIIEAFAAGLPVLASDHGAMREMVAPLGGDWLRTPGDEASWRDGLALLGDDAEVDGAGRRARRRYLESYTEEIALERLHASYRRALSGSTSPSAVEGSVAGGAAVGPARGNQT